MLDSAVETNCKPELIDEGTSIHDKVMEKLMLSPLA